MLSHAWLNDQVKGIGIREGGEVIEPTLANIHSGKFPLARNLNFVIAGEPRGLVREFLDFLYSSEGRSIVKASGYVPLDPSG